jgi:outer membrane lipoprotein-sorting protein
MKTYLISGALGLLLLAPGAVLAADEPEARAIMQEVEDREDGVTRTADMRMVLTDKHGKERSRQIRSLRKDFGEDTYRLLVFDEPADVQGTGFLTYDYDDHGRDDDQWLYLPALRKTKRIANQDKSGSFMGSDLNYSDMTSRDLEDYDFSLQKETRLGEYMLWVIEALPRSEEVVDETGYEKALLLVRQDNYVVVRGVYWTDDGKRKYRDTPGLELIDGIWTPTEVTMSTRQGKKILHKTTMTLSNVRYNETLDDSLFTQRNLERER